MRKAVADVLGDENAQLHARLDDFEDRSRRENLIFYGVADSASETWSQSEVKIREILSSFLSVSIPDEGISRAHRLGSYITNKCRPIIVKFSSNKFKDSILASKKNLRTSGVSISEDFCKTTRNSRKKLLEYGKATGQQFSLRYNTLYINKKCFVYYPLTDSVCELCELNEGTSSRPNPSTTPRDATQSRNGNST